MMRSRPVSPIEGVRGVVCRLYVLGPIAFLLEDAVLLTFGKSNSL